MDLKAFLSITVLATPLLGTSPLAWGQAAPATRAEIVANAAPRSMSETFGPLQAGRTVIQIPGAEWLQLDFSDESIGTFKQLRILSSTEDATQTFTPESLIQVGGLSAIFNGGDLMIDLQSAGENAPTVKLDRVIIGIPTSLADDSEESSAESYLGRSHELNEFFDGQMSQFLKRDQPRPFEDDEEGLVPESICGPDERTASTDPRVGRLMPIGCSGWIVDDDQILTAGHCISSATKILQFHVPASKSDGTPVAPPTRHQYVVDTSSIVDGYTGVGNDWATLRVFPNSETGLLPRAAQSGAFSLSNTASPSHVRITGYGVDGPAPNFGNPGPRDETNQTNQTHVDQLVSDKVYAPNKAVLRYHTDTQGGNSGSPVIDADNPNVAIGIHTNGGCYTNSGTNAGTSFKNTTLWNAVNPEEEIADLDNDQIRLETVSQP